MRPTWVEAGSAGILGPGRQSVASSSRWWSSSGLEREGLDMRVGADPDSPRFPRRRARHVSTP